MEKNKILNTDALTGLQQLEDESIDLTVTSPPYDAMRLYKNNYKFDFEGIARELYRVTKNGSVVVWVVGDQTEDGDESLTSFKQALYFKEVVGFKVHDTMIYAKTGFRWPANNRYHQTFEYMFILLKGNKLKTFNPIKDRKVANTGRSITSSIREGSDDEVAQQRKEHGKSYSVHSMRMNVWFYNGGYGHVTRDEIAYEHPAIFPEKLAEDHIISWSNPGDLVLDPFCGSGTTLKAAWKLRRNYLGFDINQKYVEISQKRLARYMDQTRLPEFLLNGGGVS